jgi:hypothetical protein
MRKLKMAKNDIHIVPNKDGGWLVKEEGNKEPLATTKTKKEADTIARPIARERKVELVIHNKDGKIADSDSFGKDSKKSKDKKH